MGGVLLSNYNFCRIHKNLRATPAMGAEGTSRLLGSGGPATIAIDSIICINCVDRSTQLNYPMYEVSVSVSGPAKGSRSFSRAVFHADIVNRIGS